MKYCQFDATYLYTHVVRRLSLWLFLCSFGQRMPFTIIFHVIFHVECIWIFQMEKSANLAKVVFHEVFRFTVSGNQNVSTALLPLYKQTIIPTAYLFTNWNEDWVDTVTKLITGHHTPTVFKIKHWSLGIIVINQNVQDYIFWGVPRFEYNRKIS